MVDFNVQREWNQGVTDNLLIIMNGCAEYVFYFISLA